MHTKRKEPNDAVLKENYDYTLNLTLHILET